MKNLKVVHPLRAHAQPTADGRMIILVLAHKTPRIRSHRRCRWMLSEKKGENPVKEFRTRRELLLSAAALVCCASARDMPCGFCLFQLFYPCEMNFQLAQ